MFCDNCGAEIDESVKFCPYCGTDVSEQSGKSFGQNSTNSTDSGIDSGTDSVPEWRRSAGSMKKSYFGLAGILSAAAGLFSGNGFLSVLGLIAGIIGGRKAKRYLTEGMGLARAAIIIAILACLASVGRNGQSRPAVSRTTAGESITVSAGSQTAAEPEPAAEPVNAVESEAAAETEMAAEPEVPAQPEASAESEMPAQPEASAEPEVPAQPEAATEPESVTGQEQTEGTEIPDTSQEPIQSGGTVIPGVRPEIKEFLDSYEAFMDEYVDFMENYDTSDINMLLQYTEFLGKYADFAKKCEEVEKMDMTDAEALYYAEVSLRVSQKMLRASGNLGR